MRILIWLLAVLFGFPICRPAFALADSEWSAGVASAKITPTKPVLLAGFGARTKPMEGVELDIYAKALALRDPDGNRAILVTMELCELPRDVGQTLRSRIHEKTGLDASSILLNISHTHYGPEVSTGREPVPPVTGPQAAATIEYTSWMMDRVVEVTEESLAQMQPARLSWGTGIAGFAMSRREFTDKGVINAPNPRGYVDRSVPVLRVDDLQGKPHAVVFGYACHNTTTSNQSLLISGDYAGYANQYIKKQLPGCEAIFVTGCAGDVNPYPRKSPGDAALHGEELGKEVCRVLGDKLAPIRGPLKCVMVTADLPLMTPDRKTLEKIVQAPSRDQKASAQNMLKVLDSGGKLAATYSAPVGAWQFGNDLTIVSLPEEVVAGYVPLIEDAIGPLRLWVASYSHDVCGYVPTRKNLDEGGYETKGLETEVGLFAPGVEEVLVRAARDASVKAGRKIERGTP